MLKAYLDDSGSDSDLHGVVISGLLAPATKWKRTERQWARMEQERRIGHFHASKMRRPGGPCDGWPYSKWNRLLGHCTSVVAQPQIIHVAGCVFSATWTRYGDQVNAEMLKRRARQKPVTAMLFCVNHVMQQVAHVIDRLFPGERVGVFIERPAKGKGATLKETLEEYATTPPWNRVITSTSIGDRDAFVGLRVADFVANSTFRYFRDFVETPHTPRPLRDPFSLAIASGRLESVAKYHSDGSMEELLRLTRDGRQVDADEIP